MIGDEPRAELRLSALWWLTPAAGVLLMRLQAGPGLWDAGELTAAAWSLGGSHPPGQPLHALVGYALTWLPLGSAPLRVALVSALCELGAAYLATGVVWRLARRLAPGGGWLLELAAHSAGLACLLAQPMWRQASRVEVYGLALFASLYALGQLLAASEGSRSGLPRAALAAGLAFSAHPPHALGVVCGGAALWLALRSELVPRPRRLGWAALGFALGLATFAYLPLRAFAGSPTLWGEPSTLAGFWRYVSGAAYRRNLGGGVDAAETLAYLARAVGPAPCVGLVALLALQLRARAQATARVWAWLALPLVTSAGFFLQPLEVQNPDNVAYAAPSVALGMIVGAAGLVAVDVGRFGRPVVALLLAALPLGPALTQHLASSGRADAPILESLAGELVTAPPPRAVALVRSDFAGSAWMLARAADGARPDVAFFAEGLATTSWHWHQLAAHPAFDGRPHRGEGADAQGAYVDGLLRAATDRVPVVSESDGPLDGRGRPRGPYLERVSPGAGAPVDDRLGRELMREAAHTPASDGDMVLGVVREEGLRRGRRLLARGLTRPAALALRTTLSRAPEALRAPLDHLGRPRMLAPPPVRDPAAMLPTEGDAAREVACSLLVAGDPRAALALLQWNEAQGDPRALLQFAVFEWARGATAEAVDALGAFEARAPELRAEGDALRRALQAPAATP